MKKFKFRIPTFITNNFFRKFISLSFAILIWNYVKLEINETQAYRQIKVNIKFNESEVIVNQSQEDNRVVVIVKGPRQVLKDLEGSDIIGTIKLKTFTPGLQERAIRIEDITFAHSNRFLKVVSITGKVRFHADQYIEKSLEIKPIYESRIDDGKFDLKATIARKKIKVTGPALRLQGLRYLSTEPIIVESYRKQGAFNVAASINAPDGINIGGLKVVTVTFDIRLKKSKLSLIDIPVRVFFLGQQQMAVDGEIPHVNLTVSGSPDIIDNLTRSDITLFAEIPEDAKESGEYEVIMTSKKAILKDSIKPAKIKIKLKKI